MNNAKLWLVVPPSVGLPVFLGAVAVGSFAVHVAVISQAGWYGDYLNDHELGAGQAMAAVEQTAQIPASYELKNGVSAASLLSH
jgi:light-harvesting protein B-800-850 alpha chain